LRIQVDLEINDLPEGMSKEEWCVRAFHDEKFFLNSIWLDTPWKFFIWKFKIQPTPEEIFEKHSKISSFTFLQETLTMYREGIIDKGFKSGNWFEDSENDGQLVIEFVEEEDNEKS